jgi:hypothetical protein
MKHVHTGARLRLLPLLLLAVVLLGSAPAPHPAPVTLVARPWAMATIDGGAPFVVPSTVLLEPGEYRVRVERRGYVTMEQTLRVTSGEPQSHVFPLRRR